MGNPTLIEADAFMDASNTRQAKSNVNAVRLWDSQRPFFGRTDRTPETHNLFMNLCKDMLTGSIYLAVDQARGIGNVRIAGADRPRAQFCPPDSSRAGRTAKSDLSRLWVCGNCICSYFHGNAVALKLAFSLVKRTLTR